MPARILEDPLTQALIRTMRNNGGRLAVDLDYGTPEFLELLNRMANAGLLDVEDGTDGQQVYRLRA
jgi:hypothetical protein